ncbi:MAG: 50S ribosomal protein L27 [Candidatus Pacebacteria bacterium]|nr:50S ribosomal protein L27 [Candidatus Paceibacterota bacterium]
MAHTKAIGSTQLGRDSRPQYRGVKIHDGQKVIIGNIIVRQTGSSMVAGDGVRTGSDYTLYAIRDGVVRFSTKSKQSFNGSRRVIKEVSVEA